MWTEERVLRQFWFPFNTRSTRDIDAVFQPHGVVLDRTRLILDDLFDEG